MKSFETTTDHALLEGLCYAIHRAREYHEFTESLLKSGVAYPDKHWIGEPILELLTVIDGIVKHVIERAEASATEEYKANDEP